MKVSWDDEISNIWKNKTCSKPPRYTIQCRGDSHGLSQSMNWKIHENPLNHAVNQGQQRAKSVLLCITHMGVSENVASTPLYPMVFMIIIPMKNGYFIGNIPNIFRQTHMNFMVPIVILCRFGSRGAPKSFPKAIGTTPIPSLSTTLWLCQNSYWKWP